MSKGSKKISFERLNELVFVFFILLGLFGLLSLLTYDEGDIKDIKYPPNEPVVNKGGKVGAYVAYFLYSYFGIAGFAVAAFIIFWACKLFLRPRIDGLYLKLFATFVSVLAISALASMQPLFDLQRLGIATTAPSAGGIYGNALSKLLHHYFGSIGGYMVLIFFLGISCILSTDWLLYRAGIFLWRSLPKSFSRLKTLCRKRARIPLAQPEELLRPEKSTLPAPPQKTFEEVTPPLKKIPVELFEYKVEKLHPFSQENLKERIGVIEQTLSNFQISAKVTNLDPGPTVTIYEVMLAPGVRYSKILALADDLAIALGAPSVRVVAPIPGKTTVGIEVPNPFPDIVRIREFLERYQGELRRIPLPIILGKTNGGAPLIKSLAEMPHLLIAGTTGSGKSVCLNSIITSLLITNSPRDLKLLLVDPKMVELSIFKDIPHLWAPVITEPKKIPLVLEWLMKEMEDRYMLFSKAQVRRLENYNQLGEKKIKERFSEGEDLPQDIPLHLPYIVVVIDELADVMGIAQREVEYMITRIAQKSRAVGIHLVIATQRPSVDVITGLIKANMPARIAFKVAAKWGRKAFRKRRYAFTSARYLYTHQGPMYICERKRGKESHRVSQAGRPSCISPGASGTW
jgi:S-DNA-T family DNA segregation ATPase FtsK/SpoIIIE